MKTKRNAFTMVELMIVIVIVAILAAVATPMLRGRLEKAKWTEAMAGCSAIATAVRTWAAEQTSTASDPDLTADLGFKTNDLNGKYFNFSDYDVSGVSYNPSTGALTYTITVTKGTGGNPDGTLTLKQVSGGSQTFTLISNGTTTNL